MCEVPSKEIIAKIYDRITELKNNVEKKPSECEPIDLRSEYDDLKKTVVSTLDQLIELTESTAFQISEANLHPSLPLDG